MSFVGTYLLTALTLSAASIIVLIVSSPRVVAKAQLSPGKVLKFVYILLAIVPLCPLAYLVKVEDNLVVVSGQSFQKPRKILDQEQASNLSFELDLNEENASPLDRSLLAFIFICIPSFLYLLRYISDYIAMIRLIQSSIEYKSVGRLRILISQDIIVPFAYRTLTRAYSVIPEKLVGETSNFLLSIKHENQHHRQGDTICTHLACLMKSLFFWNPVVHMLERRISEVQELACDESLVGQKGVDSRQYCNCLLAVAQNAVRSRRIPAGAAGMAMSQSAQQLKRRIIMIQQVSSSGKKFRFLSLLSCMSIGIIASVAMASTHFVYDKKVTAVTAKEFAKKFQETGFPVDVNEHVLGQLNYYIGTPKGRAFIRGALDRREQYLPMLQRKFTEYKVPVALQAIALMESGFRNLPEHLNVVKAAGLWQFVPDTARAYGLRVDEGIDDRLDVEKETDAALRLMTDLYNRFGDWRLALIGYNAGESLVQRGIDETGSHSPWVLIEAGYENNTDYLAKVMAGALILLNPSLLQ